MDTLVIWVLLEFAVWSSKSAKEGFCACLILWWKMPRSANVLFAAHVHCIVILTSLWACHDFRPYSLKHWHFLSETEVAQNRCLALKWLRTILWEKCLLLPTLSIQIYLDKGFLVQKGQFKWWKMWYLLIKRINVKAYQYMLQKRIVINTAR